VDKFTQLTGVAAPLPAINIDTDKIIPKQYLKTIKRSGLGKHLFAEMRFNADGSEKKEFVLNQPAYRQAKILIAFDNFGCGSSREHAPWALMDFGVKCVIAPSFADIFYNNCFKNGVLPLVLPRAICEQLMEDAQKGANATMTVDLEKQTVTRPDGEVVKFEIDPFRKHCLVNGLDEIGLSMTKGKTIDGYEERQKAGQPWLYSGAGAR
jgi:3-isopropylmalate/(R)-2-methylmalate dehydratase small subunit